MALLSCRNVSKYFGAMAAVNNLSFDVPAGEVLGIGGPNGAGKTTLFDAIAGLTAVDAGEIEFDGQSVRDLTADKICHLGLLRTFQLNAGFDTLTVRENVVVSSYYGYRNVLFPKLRFDRATQRRADDALELVGITEDANRIVKSIPVLQRKLLMIASAIACNPKLLLMDEPVGGLSPNEIDHITRIVEKIRKELGLTIVLIEHVMRFLVALSDRVMIMHHGEKIYDGSPKGLLTDKTVAKVYLGEDASTRLRHFITAKERDGRHATSG
jgi:branched-chain amino acid transport system ATP-binding protein